MSMRWMWFVVLGVALELGGILVLWWAEDVGGAAWLGICGSVCLVLGLPPLAGGLSLWRLEWRREMAYILKEEQRALAMTPQTVLSENMKQMHPSAVDVLALYGRMTWMILPGAKPGDLAEHVLYGTQVTWGFIAEFLRSSNDTSCIAEWRFANDGAKHFAPSGMERSWVTDREQYQQFTAYLYGVARITRAHGNQPPAWIQPWNPETVARSMGIRFDDDDNDNEIETVEEAVA